MKRIKIFITVLAMMLVSGGSVVLSPIANAANPKQTVCSTLGSGNDCSQQPANGVDINHVVTVVINTLSIVIGIIGVIMVMLAGFKYVTSGGDSSKVASAKNTLIYALIGLVVAVLAKAIVSFVLDKVK